MKKKDETTEEKIKSAAARLFIKKGYGQTSVRDIATEASINVASMNYYFRSKEKLFEIIMIDTVRGFFQKMIALLNEASISLEEKVKLFASNYIDFMIQQPELPLFIIGELRTHPESFIKKVGISNMLAKIRFLQDLSGARKNLPPSMAIQLFVSLMGMTLFPFIGRPLIQAAGGISHKQFVALMEERKRLIPIWFNEILKTL